MIVSKHSQRGFSAASREHPIALSRQHLVTHLERQFFVIEAKNHGRFGGGRQHRENRYGVQDGGKFATCLSQRLTMPQITGYYRLTHFGVSRGSTAKVHLSIRIRSRGSATVILLPCVARNTCWMASLRVFSSERSDLDFATICCACLRTLAACLRSSSGWLDDIVHLMSCQETGDVLIYPGLSGLRNFFDTVLFDSSWASAATTT